MEDSGVSHTPTHCTSLWFRKTHFLFLAPTLRPTLLFSHKHTHSHRARIAAQCPALGGVPIPMAFPSTDNALCPTKEALIQAPGLCLALSSPPPRSQKGPLSRPTRTCWGAKWNICVIRVKRRWSSHTERKSVSYVSQRVCVSVFMWTPAPGSWEYPSSDYKWCERKGTVCCQTFAVNEPRVPAAWLPTIDRNGVTLTRTNRWGELRRGKTRSNRGNSWLDDQLVMMMMFS